MINTIVRHIKALEKCEICIGDGGYNGLLAINISYFGWQESNVHLNELEFTNIFKDRTTEVRNLGGKYPYEHSIVIDGVKFFCLSEKERICYSDDLSEADRNTDRTESTEV